MRVVKQSTARSVTVFMTDSSDHVSGKTGLTLTITASKDGAAFGSISPTVTELSSGWYKLALTSSHTDTLGDLALHITGTGCDPTDVLMQVVAYDFADAVSLGLSRIDAAVSSRLASGSYTAPDNTSITSIKSKTDNLPASPAATSDIPSAATNAAAVWDKATSSHTSAGSFGAFVQKLLTTAKFLGLK
jgi:hypothetical protein